MLGGHMATWLSMRRAGLVDSGVGRIFSFPVFLKVKFPHFDQLLHKNVTFRIQAMYLTIKSKNNLDSL
jgi:hypothetical protein